MFVFSKQLLENFERLERLSVALVAAVVMVLSVFAQEPQTLRMPVVKVRGCETHSAPSWRTKRYCPFVLVPVRCERVLDARRISGSAAQILPKIHRPNRVRKVQQNVSKMLAFSVDETRVAKIIKHDRCLPQRHKRQKSHQNFAKT